jgi:hypothetical protein
LEFQSENGQHVPSNTQKSIKNRQHTTKSFISSNSKVSKREKITISETGMPLINRPQRVTILGDLPVEIKLPTEQEQSKI